MALKLVDKRSTDSAGLRYDASSSQKLDFSTRTSILHMRRWDTHGSAYSLDDPMLAGLRSVFEAAGKCRFVHS